MWDSTCKFSGKTTCEFTGDLFVNFRVIFFFQEIPLLHIYLILLENLSIQQYHAIFVINFTAIYLPFFRRVFQSILSIKTILGVSIHLFSVREAYPRDVTGSPPIPWWTKRFSTSTEFNRKSGTGWITVLAWTADNIDQDENSLLIVHLWRKHIEIRNVITDLKKIAYPDVFSEKKKSRTSLIIMMTVT